MFKRVIGINYFPSIFSMQQSAHSQAQTIKETGVVHEATINDKYWLLGETARKRGDYVIEPTEGDTLKEVSVAACLYSVARACGNCTNKKIYLAINLTYNNFFMRDDYRNLLIGRHKVKLHENGSVSEFEIVKCFILYQGYTSMLSVAMDSQYRVAPLYGEGQGLVVDIGRRTVDVSFIDCLMVKDGKSFDFGSMKVFEAVAELLRDKLQVVKPLYEIEDSFLKHKKINLLNGDSIILEHYVAEKVQALYPQLEFILKGFFESRTPDYLLVTGGGALLISNRTLSCSRTSFCNLG